MSWVSKDMCCISLSPSPVLGKLFLTLTIYSFVKMLLENINPCSLSRMLRRHLGGEHREPSSKEGRQWLLQHSHLAHKQPNLRDSGQECQQHSCMMRESRKRKTPIFKNCEGVAKSSLWNVEKLYLANWAYWFFFFFAPSPTSHFLISHCIGLNHFVNGNNLSRNF